MRVGIASYWAAPTLSRIQFPRSRDHGAPVLLFPDEQIRLHQPQDGRMSFPYPQWATCHQNLNTGDAPVLAFPIKDSLKTRY